MKWYQDHISEIELITLKHFVNQHKSVIDIGAARGDFSFYFSKISKKVIAIEPNPIKIKELINKTNNIILLEKACADVSDQLLNLRIPKNNPANATISPENKLLEFKDQLEIKQVMSIKLSDILDNNVGFVKIDAEGNEFRIINGSLDSINKYKPNFLIELTHKNNPGTIKKIFKIFKNLNYDILFYEKSSLKAINNISNEIINDIINLQQKNPEGNVENFLFLKK